MALRPGEEAGTPQLCMLGRPRGSFPSSRQVPVPPGANRVVPWNQEADALRAHCLMMLKLPAALFLTGEIRLLMVPTPDLG